MRTKAHFAPLLIAPLLLSGCFLFPDNGEWKKEWGTPELFLEHVVGNKYVHLYDDQRGYKDTDFEIRDKIRESGPFETTDKRNSTVERYFTYQGFWTPATSGPNFCNMAIWADGFIMIDHKSSLGPHGYLYFSMDMAKASNLTNFVFAKLSSAE